MGISIKTTTGISTNEKGIAGGVATLDETGKIPLSQIPGGIGAGTVDSVNGVSPDVNGDVVISTTDIQEGTNLYYTQARFTSAFTSAIAPLDGRVSTLEADLATEIIDRTNADSALDTRLTAVENGLSDEITDRTNADIALGLRIDGVLSDLSDEITARTNADSALDTRVTAVEGGLSNEILDRTNADIATNARVTTAEADIDALQADILTLTAGIDLRALEADLQQEITDRTNADNAIDLRLDDVEAHHLHSNSYYVNDGVNDFQAVLTEIGADQGNVIYASAGSYGGSTLNIENKVNLGIVCPAVGNIICELAGGRGLSISGTSERVRITNLQIEGATSITGTKGRHIFQNVQFLGGLTIDSVTDTSSTFMVFTDCEFASQNILISNITNCTIYFNRCNLSNLRIIPSSVASPFLIIVSECSGLNLLQTNLTSGVAIVGRTGYADNTIKTFTTSTNFISALGVETSFTGSYTELRNKPTLITSASQLSDYNTLLLTSMKGQANGVCELDADGLIPNHHIPPLALTKPYVVNTIADRDALTGINTGDVAIVTNDPTPANNGNYIYDSDLPSWIALYNPTSPISSVNGQTGAVTLYTGDISEGVGANSEPANLWFTDARALSASVTSDIDNTTKAPSAPTVKTYVTGLTDALDSRVDSLESSAATFATVSYVDTGLAGKVNTTTYTANDVLTKIKTVDGAGSGLDADLLDGLDSTAFVTLANSQTVTGSKTFSSSPLVPDLSASDNSTKAVNSKYVDSAIAGVQATLGNGGAVVYQGTYNASTNSPSLTSAKKGFFYQVSASGTLAGVNVTTNDQIVFIADVSGGVVQATDFILIDNTETGLTTGNLGIVNISADNTILTSGFYHVLSAGANWNALMPSFANTRVGDLIYLRVRNGGTYNISRSATSYTIAFYYNNTLANNTIQVTGNIGEYIFRCTAKNTTTTTVTWEVVTTNRTAIRTTDDLVEGTTNKYASATNVRPLLSATAPIVYTSATGVISTTLTQYTDTLAKTAAVVNSMAGTQTDQAPSVSSVKSYYTGGTGVTVSGGSISVSLGGFSIDALSDVDTTTNTPTSGQALAWDGTSKWRPTTISGGGGGASRITITNKTSSFAITDPVSASVIEEHYTMDSTGALTFTLPTAVGNNGLTYHITRVNTGAVTVATVSAQTISGLSVVVIPSQWSSISVRSNGSNWIIY